MTPVRFFTVCCGALLVAACTKESTFTEPSPPLAAINWMNAVPDTGQVDMRVVDIVSNAGLFDANFRNDMMYPEGIEAGARHIRIFNSSTDPNVAKQVLLDTTFTFSQSASYGFYFNGFARAGQAHALIVPSTAPAMGPTQFAIRLLNLAPSLAGAVPTMADTTVHPDAFFSKQIGLLPTGAPDIADAAFGVVTPYVVLDTGTYRVTFTATGTTGPAVFQVALPTGVVGTPGVDPIGGTLVPGSVLTAVILARSVTGSAAPQGGAPAIFDTSGAELVTLSTDTVTFQVGSARVLTNRSPAKPDSVLSKTKRGVSAGVSKGDIVLVTGANEPEYNGWQSVLTPADSLVCNPTNGADTPTHCAATNDTATTFFRFRYRIAGAPTSPATGKPIFQLYTINTADFTKPYINYVVDKRP